MVIDDGLVEWLVEEPGKSDNCQEDPFVETTPEKVYEYLCSTDGLAR